MTLHSQARRRWCGTLVLAACLLLAAPWSAAVAAADAFPADAEYLVSAAMAPAGSVEAASRKQLAAGPATANALAATLTQTNDSLPLQAAESPAARCLPPLQARPPPRA